jgi:hypothetical protein
LLRNQELTCGSLEGLSPRRPLREIGMSEPNELADRYLAPRPQIHRVTPSPRGESVFVTCD